MLISFQNNHFSSGFFFFLRTQGKWSDEQVMDLLELKGYSRIPNALGDKPYEDGKRYLFLTDDEEWTHLMDDWYYTHRNEGGFFDRLRLLSQQVDILTFSVGDVDESFQLFYFRKGIEERALEVTESGQGELQVLRDEGVPFPDEPIPQRGTDPLPNLFKVAASLGISQLPNPHHIRAYFRPHSKEEMLNFKLIQW
jgi:hypothetical protein